MLGVEVNFIHKKELKRYIIKKYAEIIVVLNPFMMQNT